MPASLLASQFATLEPPVDAIVIDVREPLAAQVDAVRAALGNAGGMSRE
jgi:gluconate kinase